MEVLPGYLVRRSTVSSSFYVVSHPLLLLLSVFVLTAYPSSQLDINHSLQSSTTPAFTGFHGLIAFRSFKLCYIAFITFCILLTVFSTGTSRSIFSLTVIPYSSVLTGKFPFSSSYSTLFYISFIIPCLS